MPEATPHSTTVFAAICGPTELEFFLSSSIKLYRAHFIVGELARRSASAGLLLQSSLPLSCAPEKPNADYGSMEETQSP